MSTRGEGRATRWDVDHCWWHQRLSVVTEVYLCLASEKFHSKNWFFLGMLIDMNHKSAWKSPRSTHVVVEIVVWRKIGRQRQTWKCNLVYCRDIFCLNMTVSLITWLCKAPKLSSAKAPFQPESNSKKVQLSRLKSAVIRPSKVAREIANCFQHSTETKTQLILSLAWPALKHASERVEQHKKHIRANWSSCNLNWVDSGAGPDPTMNF